jgi:hypothetical protein
MKAPKNFEALFLAAAVLLNMTAFATADETVAVPANRAVATMQSGVAADSGTPVVMVKAKRLSAAEKAALN